MVPAGPGVTTYERKVCLLGAAAVGKTSLVRRFVEGIFSESYLTTIGVKVDHRLVPLGTDAVNLVIWDIEGETEHRTVRLRYLRGAAGYLLVADGTRPETLQAALRLRDQAADRQPDLPYLILLNKADREAQWRVAPAEVERLAAGAPVIVTSALSGDRVAEAFESLAARLRPVER